MPWYQPLAEMQGVQRADRRRAGWTVGLVHKARHEQARQQFDLLKARPATVGLAQVSSSAVSAARTSSRKLLSVTSADVVFDPVFA